MALKRSHAGVLAVVVLAACSPAPVKKAEVAPTNASASSDGEAALKTCVEADNQASDDWQAVARKQPTEGNFQSGKFHDDLQTMVTRCRPVLSSFEIDGLDARKARIARMCQGGLRLKIKAYQDMLDGIADKSTAEDMVHGFLLTKKCTVGAAALSTAAEEE